jgi:DDE superfamily endonuclease/helix-turn-helix, Psq domain/Tc5 transposase DNA-binding domain
MPALAQEARIPLAIEALRTTRGLSIRRAAKLYDIPESSLRDRMKGRPLKAETRNARHNLTLAEEETLVRYILDLDSRGFAPRIRGVEDMANSLLAMRRAPPVGKMWANRFVHRRPDLKTRITRAYDFQRALCEDPDQINAWFQLVANMRTKYGIQDEDFYNFDETGFMMGVICSSMVVTNADRRGRSKQLQPGNREWATTIECASSDGFVLPPFLIVQGVNHLASWYTECDLPSSWVIKTSTNGWTNNDTGLDWIRHFDKHTFVRRKGAYRMIVLDGHESHLSVPFEEFCKEKNIITLCLPAHSSHLTQPFDVGCFSVLKRAYGRELEDLIRAHINHITKLEFFIAFKAAHIATMTSENIKAGFRGAGLVPYDPQVVLSKLDVKLRTPTPTGPPLPNVDPWVSQTPYNPGDAVSQSSHVRGRIARHQGSSPTAVFLAVEQLAKGIELMAHQMTLLYNEVRSLRKANLALSKRRRAKKTRVRAGGALSVEDAFQLIE